MGRILHPLFPAGLLALCTLLFVAGCGASSGGSSSENPGGTQREGDPGATGSAEATSADATSADAGLDAQSGELGNPALGSADAPVVMIEWGDFQ